jgi:hypothetical protein
MESELPNSPSPAALPAALSPGHQEEVPSPVHQEQEPQLPPAQLQPPQRQEDGQQPQHLQDFAMEQLAQFRKEMDALKANNDLLRDTIAAQDKLAQLQAAKIQFSMLLNNKFLPPQPPPPGTHIHQLPTQPQQLMNLTKTGRTTSRTSRTSSQETWIQNNSISSKPARRPGLHS